MTKPMEGEIAFRPMEVTDLPQIEELEVLSFPTPWPRQAFYDELLRNPFARYTVLTIGGKVVGYCGCWLILDEAHITNIALHPDYRGRGLGEALLRYVISFTKMLGATKMTLEVRVSNFIAQSLYEKIGFKRSGIRRGYYTDNHEDAIIMWVTYDDETEQDACIGN